MDARVSLECDYLCKNGMMCSSMRSLAVIFGYALRRFHGALFSIRDTVSSVCSGVHVRTARLMPPNALVAVFVVQFLYRTLC